MQPDACKRTSKALRVKYVDLADLHRSLRLQFTDVFSLESGIIKVVEVVDDSHLLALIQKPGSNVTADESRTAGNQYAHICLRAGLVCIPLLRAGLQRGSKVSDRDSKVNRSAALCYDRRTMLHVGLTGNIASGKTSARRVFTELGAHAIDADEIAHSLLAPGEEVYRRVVENFGDSIVEGDGTISRKRLGGIVFSDCEKRQLLNTLVHPGVRAEVQRRISELEQVHDAGIIIVDAALMVETGSYRGYDKLVVVYCQPALQLDRLMRRGGLTLEEAKARIAAQMPVEEKLRVADYRIDTSGTFGQTRQKIEAVYRELVLLEIDRHPPEDAP